MVPWFEDALVLCELAWKVRCLVGITGKAVVQVVPKVVGQKVGLVLDVKEEIKGETCRLPKSSS